MDSGGLFRTLFFLHRHRTSWLSPENKVSGSTFSRGNIAISHSKIVLSFEPRAFSTFRFSVGSLKGLQAPLWSSFGCFWGSLEELLGRLGSSWQVLGTPLA